MFVFVISILKTLLDFTDSYSGLNTTEELRELRVLNTISENRMQWEQITFPGSSPSLCVYTYIDDRATSSYSLHWQN